MVKIELITKQKRRNADLFKQFMGYELSYDNPKTFNEKLNWLKFNYRDPLMTRCSGKDTLRGYILEVLGANYGEELLIPLVGEGVYDSVDNISFAELPNAFALKLNNGSGKNIVCKDKQQLDIESVEKILKGWLQPISNHYYNFYEWGYKNTKSKIVCEEYLGDWGKVRDYKFFCFNGKPRFIYVSDEFDSNKEHIDMDYLTLDWKQTGYERKSYKPPKTPFKRPDSLEDMITIAEQLAQPFPFCRVDFFEVNGKPKVVEMTFYPSAGWGAFEDITHDYEVGDMLKLPRKKKPAIFFDVQDK